MTPKKKYKSPFSLEGYKFNSPDRFRPFNIIDSGRITMKDVNMPLFAVDNEGNQGIMLPGEEYQFPGDRVLEVPLNLVTPQQKPYNSFVVNTPQNYVGGASLRLPQNREISAVGVLPKNPNPYFKGVADVGVRQNFNNYSVGANVGIPFAKNPNTGERTITPQLSFKYNFDSGGSLPKAQIGLNDLIPPNPFDNVDPAWLKSVVAGQVDRARVAGRRAKSKAGQLARSARSEAGSLTRDAMRTAADAAREAKAYARPVAGDIMNLDNQVEEFVSDTYDAGAQAYADFYGKSLTNTDVGDIYSNQAFPQGIFDIHEIQDIPQLETLVEINPEDYTFQKMSDMPRRCTDSGECASALTMNLLRTQGKNILESFNMRGSAWTMLENVTARGARKISDIFESPDIPTSFNERKIKNFIRSHALNKEHISKLDNELGAGDIVALFYPPSPNYRKAFKESEGKALNTHIGEIIVINGERYVRDNVHGKWNYRKLRDVLTNKDRDGVLITGAAELKKTENVADMQEIGVRPNTAHIDNPKFDIIHNTAAYRAMATIKNNKQKLSEIYNLSDKEFNDLAGLAHAIMYKDSNLGKAENNAQYNFTSGRSAFGQYAHALKRLLAPLGLSDEESVGLGNVKVSSFFTPEEMQARGYDKILESYDLRESPEFSGLVTFEALARTVPAVKERLKELPSEIKNDQRLVDSLAAIAYNQGFEKIDQNIEKFKVNNDPQELKQYEDFSYPSIVRSVREYSNYNMRDGGALPKAQFAGEKVPYGSPEYRKAYREARIQGQILPEIDVVAERPDYAADVQRAFGAFVTAPLAGAFNAMTVPQALAVEQMERMRGRPYNYANALDINPLDNPVSKGVFGTDQRLPSQALEIENPVGAFALDAFTDPLGLIGGKSLVQTGARRLGNAFKSGTKAGVKDLADPAISRVPLRLGILDIFNPRGKEQGIEWLRSWYNNPITKGKIRDLQQYDNIVSDRLGTNFSDYVYPSRRWSPRDVDRITTPKSNFLLKSHSEWDDRIWITPEDARVQLYKIKRGDTEVGKLAPKTSTTIHEGTHQLTHNGGFFNKATEDLLQQAFKKNKDEVLPDFTGKFNKTYFTNPTEIHARINEIRKHLKLNPGDVFTDKMFNRMLWTVPGMELRPFIKNKKLFIETMNKIPATIPVAGAVGLGAAGLQDKRLGGSLPKAQPGREFFSNDATRVDMPMLTPEMLAQARGVNEPMYSTDVSKGRPYPMPAEEYATAYESPSTARKVLNRAANPMTTLGYVVRGQDIPDRVPDKGNPIDIAAEVVNPAAWADYAVMSGEALGRGDYVGAGLNALASIPAIPSAVKATPKVLQPAVDLFHPVGIDLRRIKRQGAGKGLSPMEIKQQQMREVGITSQQRKGYFPVVSEVLSEYFTPFGYDNFLGRVADIPRRIIKKEKNTHNLIGGTNSRRLDAWKLYSGMPQRKNTFKIADTSPIDHPSYTQKQLRNLEKFALTGDRNYLYLDLPTVNTDFDFIYDYADHHLLDFAEEALPKWKNQVSLLEDLRDAKINNFYDDSAGVMGGYNVRFFDDLMEYNDIWDLHPSGIQIEDWFGKPFFTHGQISSPITPKIDKLRKVIDYVQDVKSEYPFYKPSRPRTSFPFGSSVGNLITPPPPAPPVNRYTQNLKQSSAAGSRSRQIGGSTSFENDRTRLPEAQEGKEIYKVKSGDTFLGIANRLEIPREDFIEANPDINIDKLSLGEKLNVPAKKAYVPTNDVIPSQMLWRQAFAESNWNFDAQNDGGFKGLGQIGDDVIADYKKEFNVKEVDPFDPVQNSKVHKWFMNKLYNSEWVNKPNQNPGVRLAKSLVAYNWGPKKTRDWLTKKRESGEDIYNSFDWVQDLPDEPKNYVGMIMFNENTEDRNYVGDLVKKMKNKELLTQILDLYRQQEGGEVTSLDIYRGYINGEYVGTDMEAEAEKIYDKLNRIYYYQAKQMGMSAPNFIMSNLT